MKTPLPFVFVFLIALLTGKSVFADELGDKSAGKKTEWVTERDKYWHQFWLGLEEDKSARSNLYTTANRILFEDIKATLRNPKVMWFGIEFSPDSATSSYLVLLSINRFPNGRIKEVAARYIQKNPKYEDRLVFARGKKQFRDSYYAFEVADHIAISLPEIQRQVEVRAIQSIIDSMLANRKGDAQMPGMGRITGEVFDSTSNKPIIGAEVEFVFRHRVYPELGTRTDEKGHFAVLNVPAGDWEITVHYDCDGLSHNISVKEDQTISAGTLKLSAFPIGFGRITGQVRDSATNEPLKGARVRLFCPNGIHVKLGAATDENGNFEIEKVPPGIYQIGISYDPLHLRRLINNIKIKDKQILSIGIVKLVKTTVIITD